MYIPERGNFEAFSIYADINGYTLMVRKSGGTEIAGFMSNVLRSIIAAIEAEGGEVINFVGDAVVGLIPTADDVVKVCTRIANKVNLLCVYISSMQNSNPALFDFAPGGISIKIGVGHGLVDVSDLTCRFLGSIKHIVGDPINTAARITSAGSGNRCHISESAAQAGLNRYLLDGPYDVPGKKGEGSYTFYRLDLGDIWMTDDDPLGLGLTYWP